MVEYRRSLAASFLFRFFVDVALKLEKEGSGYKAADWLPAGHESAAVHFERPASQGVQYFNKVGEQNVVGQPVRHMAADLQARPHLWVYSFQTASVPLQSKVGVTMRLGNAPLGLQGLMKLTAWAFSFSA